MHTTTMMSSDEFAVSLDGAEASLDDVFEGLDVRDRFGFVLRTPGAGLACAGLLLAAITRWYDFVRAERDAFFLYPDFYAFHVGRPLGNHGHLDIWPEHKEVVVATETEAIVAALNDRCVTRLIVEQGPAAERPLMRETLVPAGERIRTALAFDPTAAIDGADVTVAGPASVDALAELTVEACADVRDAAFDAVVARRAAAGGRESYRRVEVGAALAMLPGSADEPVAGYGMSDAYHAALHLTPEIIARHATVLSS